MSMGSHLRRLKRMFETPKTTQNNKGILLQPEIVKDCDRHNAFPQWTSEKGVKSKMFWSQDYLNHKERIRKKWPFSGPLPTFVRNCPWPRKKAGMKPSPVHPRRRGFFWLVCADQWFYIMFGKSLTLPRYWCFLSPFYPLHKNKGFRICDCQYSLIFKFYDPCCCSVIFSCSPASSWIVVPAKVLWVWCWPFISRLRLSND